jgi:hypothetical protein
MAVCFTSIRDIIRTMKRTDQITGHGHRSFRTKTVAPGNNVLNVIERYVTKNHWVIALYLLFNFLWTFIIPPLLNHRLMVSVVSTCCLIASIVLMKYKLIGFGLLILFWNLFECAVGIVTVMIIINSHGALGILISWDILLATIVYIVATFSVITAMIFHRKS